MLLIWIIVLSEPPVISNGLVGFARPIPTLPSCCILNLSPKELAFLVENIKSPLPLAGETVLILV